ncbi:hypothetical protein GCM10025866_36100 [Naasia aerilata]|uniref:Uncharacterized protein n=1 Tax=Naasia aerilata TaxID=1162966 RepID=A0ABM8GH63_9MICO|nr:hypothetical protein GCM10025866_36100 [Naasia aerilata]
MDEPRPGVRVQHEPPFRLGDRLRQGIRLELVVEREAADGDEVRLGESRPLGGVEVDAPVERGGVEQVAGLPADRSDTARDEPFGARVASSPTPWSSR